MNKSYNEFQTRFSVIALSIAGLLFMIFLLITIFMTAHAASVGAQGKGGEVIAKPTPAAKRTPAPRRTTSKRNNPKPKRGNPPTGNTNAADAAFWNLIKDSTKAEDFRSYLNAYPNGQFVEAARGRLGNLEKPGSTTTSSSEPPPIVYPPPSDEARKAAEQRASEGRDLRNRLGSDFGTTSTDYAEVENKFRQAIALDPGNRDYHNELAYTLHLQHKSSEAESIYRQSVKAAPSDAKSRHQLANFLWEVFKFEEALSEIRVAVQLEPDGPYEDTLNGRRATGSYRYTLADYLRTMRRFPEAEAEFSELIRRVPKTYSYRSALSQLLQQINRISAAENILREAVQLFPDYDTNARGDLRRLLIKQGKLAEADVLFRQWIESAKTPGQTSTSRFHWYAFELWESGRNKEAEEILREGLRLASPEKDKWTISYRKSLAMVLRKQNKLSEAEAEIRQVIRDALRLDQSYLYDFRQELVRILTAQGKMAEAEAEWQELLRIYSGGGTYAAYADWLETRNRLTDAEAAFKEAVRLSQGDHMTSVHRGYLANFLAKQSRCAEAEIEYRKIVEETIAEDHLTFARCLDKQNKLAAAETEFKEALRRFPFDPGTQAEVGDFFSRRKKWKEAEAAYREAVRLEPAESKYKEKLDEAMNAQKPDKPPVRKSAHLSAPDAFSRSVRCVMFLLS